MSFVRKIVCTTVAGAALFGLTGFAATASAGTVSAGTLSQGTVSVGTGAGDTVSTPIDQQLLERYRAGTLADDEMRAEATRGFDVTNLSGKTLRLTGYTGDHSDDELPPVRSVVEPGETIRFELVWQWAMTHAVTASFDVVDRRGRSVGSYEVSMKVQSMPFWSQQSSSTTDTSGGVLWGGGQEQFYGDPKGTLVEVPAGERRAQADVLNSICTAGKATCSFSPTAREQGWTGPQQFGETWTNDGTIPQTKELTGTTTVELTSNPAVAASAKSAIERIFETATRNAYSKAITMSQTYAERTSVTVPALTTVDAVGNFPVIRDTGDFTVTLANTTWILKGVTFTHPDPSRPAEIIWRSGPAR